MLPRVLLVLVVGGLPWPSGVFAQPLARFADEAVFTGLTRPTVVRFLPDGRVFVAEKSGVVRVFDSVTDVTPTTFVDLRDRVHDYWDRGLLGLALHPDFAANPYVYALYTLDARPGAVPPSWGDQCPDPPGGTRDGCVVQARLSRFRAQGDVALGEEVLLQSFCQQFPSHSIGALAFGPDGALYVSSGDGANFNYVDYGQSGDPRNPCGDPPVAVGGRQRPPAAEGGALRSQSVRGAAAGASLDGALLRVDPATGAALPDNPLQGGTSASDDRIIAYGLRNPFRFALRPGSHEIWIADVGWDTWEEIDVIADRLDDVVENFGWPCYEGEGRQPGYDAADLALCESLYAAGGAHTPPFYAYQHEVAVVPGDRCDAGDSAISGLAFYEGANFPAEYRGALFFADYARGCIWALLAGGDGDPDPGNRRVFMRNAAGPVDLTVGPDGALYYAAIRDGSVRRIRYANDAPLARLAAEPLHGPAPLEVRLDASGSTDPNGDALRFAWDVDGDGELDDATGSQITHTFTRAGSYTVRVRVSDAAGLADDEIAVIAVANRPPAAVIEAPLSGDLFRVAETIAFRGRGDDPDEGALPSSGLSWEVVLQHCADEHGDCHEHTVMALSGTDRGEFSAPDHEYPSYLEVRLTATDALGLTGSAAVAVQPETAILELASEPVGLELAVDGRSAPAPFAVEAIVGSTHTVSASSPQAPGDTEYAFASWSDGGEATHLVTLGAGGLELVAAFSDRCGDGTLDGGEQCDDGNVAAGDCCSGACTFELAGSACEDDGDRCTHDRCDGAGACEHVPVEICEDAGAVEPEGVADAGLRGSGASDRDAGPDAGGGTGPMLPAADAGAAAPGGAPVREAPLAGPDDDPRADGGGCNISYAGSPPRRAGSGPWLAAAWWFAALLGVRLRARLHRAAR